MLTQESKNFMTICVVMCYCISVTGEEKTENMYDATFRTNMGFTANQNESVHRQCNKTMNCITSDNCITLHRFG